MLGLGVKGEMITGIRLSPIRNGNSYVATLGPLARYYFGPSGKSMQWFAQSQIGIGNGRLYQQAENQEYIPNNRFAYSLDLATGFSWKLHPGLALESKLNFGYDKLAGLSGSKKLSLDVSLRPFLSQSDGNGTMVDQNDQWLLNGQFQIGQNFSRYYPSDITLDIEALRFLSPHFALGGRVNYQQQYFGNNTNNTATLESAVQGRYYLNPRQKLQVFLLGEAGMSHDFQDKDLQLTSRAGVGINYFLTDRMALELSGGLSRNSGGSTSPLWLSLGMKYLIGK